MRSGLVLLARRRSKPVVFVFFVSNVLCFFFFFFFFFFLFFLFFLFLQLVFLAPIPILLLVWMRADGVLWYHSGFVLPSIILAGLIMPLWSKQPYGMPCHRVKVIQW